MDFLKGIKDFEKSVNSGAIYGASGSSKTKHKRQSIARSTKNKVLDRQNNKCAMCKRQLKASSTHFDHKKESHKGGKSTSDNLRAVCANCHYERHNEDKAREADRKRKKQSTRVRDDPFGLGGW